MQDYLSRAEDLGMADMFLSLTLEGGMPESVAWQEVLSKIAEGVGVEVEEPVAPKARRQKVAEPEVAKAPLIEPEYQSIEDFIEFLRDEERKSPTVAELDKVATATKTSNHYVAKALRAAGFTIAERRPERSFRTIGSNPHNRWSQEPTHTGPATDQITGFAGKAG